MVTIVLSAACGEEDDVDHVARRHWINIYRSRARAVRNDLQALEVPLNDLVAGKVERRLRALLAMYEAGIDELQKADDLADG